MGGHDFARVSAGYLSRTADDLANLIDDPRDPISTVADIGRTVSEARARREAPEGRLAGLDVEREARANPFAVPRMEKRTPLTVEQVQSIATRAPGTPGRGYTIDDIRAGILPPELQELVDEPINAGTLRPTPPPPRGRGVTTRDGGSLPLRRRNLGAVDDETLMRLADRRPGFRRILGLRGIRRGPLRGVRLGTAEIGQYASPEQLAALAARGTTAIQRRLAAARGTGLIGRRGAFVGNAPGGRAVVSGRRLISRRFSESDVAEIIELAFGDD